MSCSGALVSTDCVRRPLQGVRLTSGTRAASTLDCGEARFTALGGRFGCAKMPIQIPQEPRGQKCPAGSDERRRKGLSAGQSGDDSPQSQSPLHRFGRLRRLWETPIQIPQEPGFRLVQPGPMIAGGKACQPVKAAMARLQSKAQNPSDPMAFSFEGIVADQVAGDGGSET
jgi:hypothetical protein